MNSLLTICYIYKYIETYSDHLISIPNKYHIVSKRYTNMNLNEIQDPELLKLFAEYEKEFAAVEKKADKKKPAPTKKKRILRPAKRKKIRAFDGHIRSIIWEYR